MRGGVDGALQLGDHLGNGTIQVVSDMANGSPIVRLPRLNANGLKQDGGGDVVGMGDKWDRHPAKDGFIFRVDPPHLPAGPEGEDKSARDRQQEGEPNNQRAAAGFSHNPI
ncbi:MAG: hypothetical protein ABSH45_10455 [Bryobacteraceae bacterium]|jgi:hypothetical protein